MKIIRTASYMKLAVLDPYSIGQIALGIAMAAKDTFEQSFPALERVGSMLSSRGRTDPQTILKAMGDINQIIGLRESVLKPLSEGQYDVIEKLSKWLCQIQEEYDLEDQWSQPQYDPEGHDV